MRLIRLDLIVMAALLVTVTTTEAQVPQIDSLSAPMLARSGRLRIFGANFGSGGGASQILIDGNSAIVSRWSASQITAYVPEQAGPGQTLVQVVTSGGSSNTIPLAVSLREQQGRVRWTFEADVANLWFRPAIAPDGTVYVHGSEGFVYALTLDGGLKWIYKANWFPYVPPHTGSKGEVYVGSIQTITAVNSDGTEGWQFMDNNAQGISVSAKPGPDGNIFAANDLGLGAYSLTPGGQLRWNNPGNPMLVWYGGTGAEMVFGPSTPGGPISQMYVVMNPQAQSWLQAFRLSDGAQQFSVPTGGRDPLNQNQTQPAVGPDGTIYITHLRGTGGIGWTLEAFNPTNGQSMWLYNNWNTSGFSPPDVGPDGVVYYVASGSRLVSFDPATLSERWNRFDGTILSYPTVSPNNDMIVLGGALTFGQQGFVRAYSTDGNLLWEVPLPGTSLPRWWTTHRPRFTDDGQTVYVSTSMLDSNPRDPHSFLFAIATGTDSTGGNIPCEAISFFNARCNASGTAQAMVRLLNSTEYAGETVEFQLDDTVYPVELITNGTHTIGRLLVPSAGFGQHTISLTDPAGCYDPVTFVCPANRVASDIEFDALWAEYDALYSGGPSVQTLPEETKLVGNYPNPFNPSTTLSYGLSQPGWVSLKIFNMLGQHVRTLADEHQVEGYHEVVWDGRDEVGATVASGIYVYRMVTGSFVQTKRMLLIR